MRFTVQTFDRIEMTSEFESEYIESAKFDVAYNRIMTKAGITIYESMGPSDTAKIIIMYDDLETNIKSFNKREFREYLDLFD